MYDALWESWQNGNRNHVANELSGMPSSFTAVFITQGLADGYLNSSDCNVLCSLLNNCQETVEYVENFNDY